MDPEKRLLIIHEYLPVKVKILLLCTVIGMLGPKGMGIVKGNRPLYDLQLLLCGTYFYLLLGPVFFFLLLILGFLMDLLYNYILIGLVCRVDRLIFLGSICLLKEDGNRHE